MQTAPKAQVPPTGPVTVSRRLRASPATAGRQRPGQPTRPGPRKRRGSDRSSLLTSKRVFAGQNCRVCTKSPHGVSHQRDGLSRLASTARDRFNAPISLVPVKIPQLLLRVNAPCGTRNPWIGGSGRCVAWSGHHHAISAGPFSVPGQRRSVSLRGPGGQQPQKGRLAPRFGHGLPWDSLRTIPGRSGREPANLYPAPSRRSSFWQELPWPAAPMQQCASASARHG
jgi:hypothetical protein